MSGQRALALAMSGPGLVALAAGGAVGIGVVAASVPEAAVGVALSPIVVTVLTLLVYRRVAAHPDADFLRRYFRIGVVLRIGAVGAQLAVGFIIYGGRMDYVSYLTSLRDLIDRVVMTGRFDLLSDSAWVHTNFTSYSVLALFGLIGLMMLLVGPNIVAIFLVGAPVSALAAYLFYRAFERMAPDAASRRRFAAMIFLFPSVVFWSVFLGKDVWMFLFLSCATLMLARVVEAMRPGRLLLLGVFICLVFLLRVHVAGTLFLAVAVALFFRPLPLRGAALYLRPVLRVAVSGAMIYAFATVTASAVQQLGMAALSVDMLADRAFATHTGFVLTEGGSALPQVMKTGAPSEVAAFIPLGLTTLLFRPFLWEAHNVVAVVAGIENLFFLGLVLVRLRSIWYAIRLMPTSPMTVFAFVFFVATAIVLSFEWNLGATQRHRTMVLPFFFMLLALPSKPSEKGAAP